MKKAFNLLLLVFFASVVVGIAEAGSYSVLSPQGAVVVDGRLDEAVWQGEPTLSDFRFFAGANEGIPCTRVWIAQNDQALLMAFRCDEPAPDKMRLKATAPDSAVYSDDSVEIYLVPERSRREFVQICVNARGVVADRIGRDSFSSWQWDSGVQVKAAIGKREWVLELAIPFENLPLGGANSRWAINVVRNRHAQSNSTVTSLKTAPFNFSEVHAFDDLAGVKTGQSGIVLAGQDFGRGWQGQNKARLILENTTSAPIRGTARVEMGFQAIGEGAPFQVQPGARAIVELPWECPANRGETLLALAVQVDGHTTQRVFQGLPAVPDILSRLSRCVFAIVPGEPLTMEHGVRYGIADGASKLSWEIWTPDQSRKLGEGANGIVGDESTMRLSWRDFRPGRYVLKRAFSTDKGVLARTEDTIVLVAEPWR